MNFLTSISDARASGLVGAANSRASEAFSASAMGSLDAGTDNINNEKILKKYGQLQGGSIHIHQCRQGKFLEQ